VKTTWTALLERYLAPLVGATLLIYLMMNLFVAPDLDFLWNRYTHRVIWVDPDHPQPAPGLQVGDKIIQMDGVSMADYLKPTGPASWTLLTPQNTLILYLERSGQHLVVNWPVFPITPEEVIARLVQLAPAVLCLAAALVVQLFMRPKNLTRRLLLVVLSLAALWLSTSGISSALNLPLAGALYRFSIWVWMLALLHLMWVYPYPLGVLSNRVVIGGYLAAGLLGLAHLFNWVPRNIYLMALAATFLASLGLFGLHFTRKEPVTRSVF